MADTKRPDEVTWFRCCNCKELRISRRVPKGWWVMVSGELTCSVRCSHEAHERWKVERMEAAFEALRKQQELEERRERLMARAAVEGAAG